MKNLCRLIENLFRYILPKSQIQLVEVSGCMGQHKEVVETGAVLRRVSKVFYASRKPSEYYVCRFPSKTRHIPVVEVCKDEATGIHRYER